ncbi:MAG: hypothetical protein ACKO3K_20085 [Cuspidothrix sp.]
MLQLRYKIIILSTLLTVGLTTNIANAETKFNDLQLAQIKSDNSNYIGLRYDRTNFPKDLKDVGGWIVGDSYSNILYSISHVVKKNQEMLWFQIITRDKYGINNHQVIDVLNLPKLNKSEGINSFCLIKGVRDPEITAIIKYQETEYFKNIKKAWRANRKSGKFEQIFTRNIVCENQGWGV